MLGKRWKTLLIFLPMGQLLVLGCGDRMGNNDDETVQLVETSPQRGGEMTPNGVLTLTFSQEPQSVTVNGIPASTDGKVSTWRTTPQLLFHLDPQIQKELDDRFLSEETVQRFKAQGIRLPPSVHFCGSRTQWLIVDEENRREYEVRVRREEGKQGKLSVYNTTALPLGQTVLNVEWKSNNGVVSREHIALNITKVDNTPPTIKRSTIEGGDHVVNVEPLIEDGIMIEFNEPIQQGFINLRSEDTELEPWITSWGAYWGQDWGKLVVVAGHEGSTNKQIAYIIDFIVRDLAGNKLESCQIKFTSNRRL